MKFKARHFEFVFPRPAMVMGVVNVTPDSFSDGGRFLKADQAVAHALNLAEQGAHILDVGGESTRPGAVPVSEEEELHRVVPVIEKLANSAAVPISIDTMKPNVARAALAAGACIVNDVGANRQDTAMWEVVAEANAGYVCMHMQGNPQTMQVQPSYGDVVAEVRRFFEERLAVLSRYGIGSDQVVLDVGIGFGKALAHNLQLLAALRHFTTLARPLLLGVSRKSFIGKVSQQETADRLPGSLACACLAVESGANILRVHDVAETIQAVRVTEAILRSIS